MTTHPTEALHVKPVEPTQLPTPQSNLSLPQPSSNMSEYQIAYQQQQNQYPYENHNTTLPTENHISNEIPHESNENVSQKLPPDYVNTVNNTITYYEPQAPTENTSTEHYETTENQQIENNVAGANETAETGSGINNTENSNEQTEQNVQNYENAPQENMPLENEQQVIENSVNANGSVEKESSGQEENLDNRVSS